MFSVRSWIAVALVSLVVSSAWGQGVSNQGIGVPNAAPAGVQSLTASGGTTARVLDDKLGESLSVRDFGATGDGVTDDAPAINAAFAYALSAAGNCAAVEFPRGVIGNGNPNATGVYIVKSDIIVDISVETANCVSDGLKIIIPTGGIDITSSGITATPTMEIRCGTTVCNNFTIRGGRLTVKGSNNGPAMVIGKSDLSDTFSGLTIDYLVVLNSSSSAGATGLQLNNLLGAKIRAQSVFESGSGGSTGDAVQINNVNASIIEVALANWSSGNGIHLTNGTSKNNDIYISMTGTNGTCINIDSANAQNNRFYPYFAGCTNNVNATAGSGNILFNPQFVGTPYVASVGISELRSKLSFTRPTPTTGQTVTFTTPQTTPFQYLTVDSAAALAALTITLPACNSSADGFVAGFGTQFPIAALTVNTAAGGLTGQPRSLGVGQGSSFICVGGESTWRPATGVGSSFSSLLVGNTALTLTTGEIGLNTITASGVAPGAAGLKFEAVCGTAGGSAKIIAYAGTSTTPVTIADNIGSGVTGC